MEERRISLTRWEERRPLGAQRSHRKTKTWILFTQTRPWLPSPFRRIPSSLAPAPAMSILVSSYLPPPYFFGGSLRFSLPRRCRSLHCRPLSTPCAAGRNGGVAILWFKHDLRVDDHPALVAASQFSDVLPLYVFDHRILSRFSEEMLEIVILAVTDLRKSLRDLGSDLMIRFGTAESVIQELVYEVKATDVFAEEEIEYDLRKLMDTVNKALERVRNQVGRPNLVIWQTPLYDLEVCGQSLTDLPSSHDQFLKHQLPITSPLPVPTLPDTKTDLNWGLLPTIKDLKQFMKESLPKRIETLELMKDTSAEASLVLQLLKRVGSNRNGSSLKRMQKSGRDTSIFDSRKGNSSWGGANNVLNAVAAYLRYSEGTGRDDWQEIHEMVRNSECRPGASFVKLFSHALFLGIISRRRVHHEAIKYEKERNAGFLSPFGFSSATIAAAIEAVCSMEWYWLMGLKGQVINQATNSTRIWRWNGFLIEYKVVGLEGPAVLLVHGFGAFLEHYRDNMHDIANEGNQVWAITLLGFGKSEKPNILYTELLWAELVKDFIVEVIARPVNLVGNSIGGYIAAIVAGLWPALIKSIVLINTAGNVVSDYTPLAIAKERQTSGASWLGARLLLLYLRLKIKDTVKSCYPTRTERADDWLISEMLRASYDPGVLVVLESIFSFDLSIPLNYLLDGIEEKVLIVQGMKDPISNSESFVSTLQEHCPGVVIKQLDAGHCPHDEKPAEVNSIISKWIVTIEGKAAKPGILS